MRIKILSLTLFAAVIGSTNLWAQGSGQGGGSGNGVSGSAGFQIGGNTVTANTVANALSFVIPSGGGAVVVITSSGPVTITVGSAGSSSIAQVGGSFDGPGAYVLTDPSGNTVTIVVGEDGSITSVSEGDTTS